MYNYVYIYMFLGQEQIASQKEDWRLTNIFNKRLGTVFKFMASQAWKCCRLLPYF